VRAIGGVTADAWATSLRDLALDAQLVTPVPAAGVTCWRIDGDLIKWVDLIRHGIQSKRFTLSSLAELPQQQAA
jgi:hypothetical protein